MNSVSTFGPDKNAVVVVNEKQKMPRAKGLGKKDFLKTVEE